MTVLLRYTARVLRTVVISVPANRVNTIIENANPCGREIEERFGIEPLPILRAS